MGGGGGGGVQKSILRGDWGNRVERLGGFLLPAGTSNGPNRGRGSVFSDRQPCKVWLESGWATGPVKSSLYSHPSCGKSSGEFNVSS